MVVQARLHPSPVRLLLMLAEVVVREPAETALAQMAEETED
jgi:hypothetical protein